MKKITSSLLILTFILTSCSGEDGRDGLDGAIIASSAFEIENVDFNPSVDFENNYRVREYYGFHVWPTDVTLVYVLWLTENGENIWRLVPQTVIFDDGNDLVYNYEFTQTYVDFFIEGSNLSLLDDVWTQNQIFRVVVVPADNVGRGTNSSTVDYSDLDAVISHYNITEFQKR